MFLCGSISVYILVLVPVFSQLSLEDPEWLECSKTCGGGYQCRKKLGCQISAKSSCCSGFYRECGSQKCQSDNLQNRRLAVPSYLQNQHYAGRTQASRQSQGVYSYNFQQPRNVRTTRISDQHPQILPLKQSYVSSQQGFTQPLQSGYFQRSSSQQLGRYAVPRQFISQQRRLGVPGTDSTKPIQGQYGNQQNPIALPLLRQNVQQQWRPPKPVVSLQNENPVLPGLSQSTLPLYKEGFRDDRGKAQSGGRPRVFTKDDAYNARVKQCAVFNSKPYGELKELFEWVPCTTSGAYRECELRCLAKSHRFCAELAPLVEDGTPCYSDLRKVCIGGKCQIPPSDCEYKDGRCLPEAAAAKRKQVVHGTFQPQNMKIGYNPVITIPTGSTNINITELTWSRNYLALKDHNGEKYYINGKWVIDKPQVFRCAGTLFTYSRPGERSRGESIVAKGPTEKDLDVMLIYQNESPQIFFSYTLPQDFPHVSKLSADSSEGTGSEFQWKETGYSPCSRKCAGGTQHTLLRCVYVGDNKIVDDSSCSDKKPTIKQRVCNLQPCPAEWSPQPWKACSVQCGTGIQTRNVQCKQLRDRRGQPVEVLVPISMCLGPRIPASQQCKMMPCDQVHQWKSGQWTQCSVSCGQGTQTRTAQCWNQQTNRTVDDSMCSSKSKPPITQLCNGGSCRTEWFVQDSWTQCSVDCGDGLSGRQVFCATIEGKKVPEERCDQSQRPISSKKCNLGNCQAIWLTSPWSKCSVGCGEGIETRVVACAGLVGGTYQEFPETACPMGNKPLKERSCTVTDCQPEWYSTKWSKCSKTCNSGVQTRQVVCTRGLDHVSGGCSSSNRPKSRRSCNTQPCPRSMISLASDVREKVVVPSYCKDRKHRKYCLYVIKSTFCKYKYYREVCCSSCTLHASLSTQR